MIDEMKKILEKNNLLKPPKAGEIIQAKIIAKKSACAFFDLGVWGTGTAYGKEFYEAKNILKNLKIGDSAFVKIVSLVFNNFDSLKAREFRIPHPLKYCIIFFTPLNELLVLDKSHAYVMLYKTK